MDPTSSVTFSTSLRIMKRALQNRRAFVFMKHIHIFDFLNDRSFRYIRPLSSSGIVYSLWSCTETVILTINRLESIETSYMDKNPGMFSSKTFISFRLKKEIHKHLGWHGWVNYEEICIWKWTNPLRTDISSLDSWSKCSRCPLFRSTPEACYRFL